MIFRDFIFILKHATNRFCVFSFAAYGALWTVIESVSAFDSQLKPTGAIEYGVLVLLSLTVGAWKAWPSKHIEICIPISDSSVVVEFGDIFSKEGCIAIQVNEFFDSLLGDHVSPQTLHGQFIRDVLGGQSASFDALVESALAGVPHEVVQRRSGNSRRYKIGTTASVDVNSKRYLLFAFAKTDIVTLKAYATLHEFWDALSGLWEVARVRSNGNPIFVPLIGTGLSGVGLPERYLLELLILSFVYHTKKNKISKQVTIVLHPSLRRMIDLKSIKLGEQ